MPFITARVVSVVQDDAIAALANAGPDQSVLCAALVQLQASIIGDDIANHTFEWEQTLGTPVTLINPNTLTPSFVNPQVSDLEFTFYLDRNTPFEDSDVVTISRAPTASVTTEGGGIATIGTAGVATIETSQTGLSTELIIESAHVTGWGFTNPPTARYSPIFEASDLDRVRRNLTGSYWLMNDIDLSRYSNWEPIGSTSNPFFGDFQGNGFKIINLTITSASKDAGLFSCVGNGAIIQDTGVTDANISGVSSSFYKGILSGSVSGTVTINDCYTTGNVASGGDLAGGFVGDTGTDVSSTFTNTYADVTVTGGGTDTGGWAGTFSTTPTYVENYGNTDKTAAVVGTGSPLTTEVDGRTTAELNLEAQYTDWDFTSTWEIDEGVSPATLQQDTSYVREGGFCDDQWMIIWNPPSVANPVFGPTYTYKGAIIEEMSSSGATWIFPRFIPPNRAGALMTPETLHRITTVWDYSQLGPRPSQVVINIIKEVQIINDVKFISKETSPSFGPYGNDSFDAAGGKQATTDNLVITIQNPRAISMQQSDTGSYVTGGTEAITENFSIIRVNARIVAPVPSDPFNQGASGKQALTENTVIDRLSGASIG